ncbi:MAG: hypothetical protein ACTSVC_12620 [Promethearchaeota archaeon]
MPETFGELKGLENVILRNVSEEINTEVLKGLPNLKNLSLRNTFKMSDSHLEPIFDLVQLEELNLSRTTFHWETLENIGKLVNLKKLNLAWCALSDGALTELPESMKNLKDLEELDLTGTKIGEQYGKPWPAWLMELPKLKLIHYKFTQLSNGYGNISDELYKRNTEAYDVPETDPNETQSWGPTEWEQWFEENKSEILKLGWTGID